MLKKSLFCTLAALILLAAPAMAHFQVLVPSNDTVAAEGDRTITLDIRFTHPMARGPLMDMAEGAKLGVLVRGASTDLTDSLEPRTVDGQAAYTAEYTLQRPGAHVFYLEPAPYWEAGEKSYLVHYTKVVVDAFGAWGGWDAAVGFPVEIIPLSRPYGLWTGNVFRGVVTRDGKPVPHAHIEVEYLNDAGEITPPASAFETQVLKADENGIFVYGLPKAGWWGFAALVDTEQTMTSPDGEEVDVETGGLLWVRATDIGTPAEKDEE
jgi:cobalt/nickel transport protein